MNFNRHLILASKSPRRQQLLKEAGFDFEVRSMDVEESYPDTIPAAGVASFLAEKKARAFENIGSDELVITADTIVKVDNTLLGKPKDEAEAENMLNRLSGRAHEVITGVCIRSIDKCTTFDDTTNVAFKTLTQEEINYYIRHFAPMDKAGAYGIQEWIGMIGIQSIQGSYFNVMGLPVHKLYQKLLDF